MVKIFEDSSSLLFAKYNNKDLTVKFVNGGIYKYKDVPKVKVDELFAAESVGGYFYRNIRTSYNYDKVDAFN